MHCGGLVHFKLLQRFFRQSRKTLTYPKGPGFSGQNKEDFSAPICYKCWEGLVQMIEYYWLQIVGATRKTPLIGKDFKELRQF